MFTEMMNDKQWAWPGAGNPRETLFILLLVGLSPWSNLRKENNHSSFLYPN